jgi:hypothetical protein
VRLRGGMRSVGDFPDTRSAGEVNFLTHTLAQTSTKLGCCKSAGTTSRGAGPQQVQTGHYHQPEHGPKSLLSHKLTATTWI